MIEKSTVGTGEAGLMDIGCGLESICVESDSKCGKGSAVVRKGEPRTVESKREKWGSTGRGGVMGDVGRVKGSGLTLKGIAEDDAVR